MGHDSLKIMVVVAAVTLNAGALTPSWTQAQTLWAARCFLRLSTDSACKLWNVGARHRYLDVDAEGSSFLNAGARLQTDLP